MFLSDHLMMDYSNYTANDLIKDEMFQQWIYDPDPEWDAYWRDVMHRYPHLAGHVEEARQFLMLFGAGEHEVSESRIGNLKKRIDRAIDAPGIQEEVQADVTPLLKPAGKGNKRKFRVYLAAASVSILLIAFFFLFYHHPLDTILSQHRREVTPKGHRTVLTLDDGTKVWLNADSRLTYPESFAGAAMREVSLEGEAFFDVTEDAARPFVVRTPALRVRVLGTSFNVRCYSQDNEVSTTLVKGRVVIESENNATGPVTLLPSQQAVFEKRSGKITLENQVNTEQFTSWREGKLSFEELPLSAIVEELERWYNVTIAVEDSASLGCRFSARINNKTLEEVLELFRASDGIDYAVEGNEVLIRGRLCDE